jgi:DNA replication and repair protein RecF
VRVGRVWLADFRSWRELDLTLAPGLTVVVGGNGAGKTSLLEAIAYLATLRSFRGAHREALVRHGCERAVVRAEGERSGRNLLLEAELHAAGRDRVLVNRQPLARARDLLGALRVSVFSPDDLVLVKGPPAARRDFLDTTLVALHPRYERLQADLERVLRQRNALLRQAGGRVSPEVATTLDVWDARLAVVGEAIGAARRDLVARLAPLVARAYARLAGSPTDVGVAYAATWREGGLAAALAEGREEDLRRAQTTVGPHRDELEVRIEERPARSCASQGEQRCLALALRLAAHELVTDVAGEPPVLLLDDVFSELDAARAAALCANLPAGQALLTTAGGIPEGIAAERVVRIADGRVLEERAA